VIKCIAPIPLLFKRAEREKIAWQAILEKEPACGKGPDSYREEEGLRRKKVVKRDF